MYNFVSQLTKLVKDSELYRKYYATNLYTIGGYGMPNCTCYALGRVNQLQDLNGLSYNNFTGMHGNANRWGDPGYIGQDWVKSQIPALGAIACYNHPTTGGHVAVVEQIFSNGNVTLSNSAWRGSSQVGNEKSSGWWFLRENINVKNFGTSYTFKYYLYPPFIDKEPIPPEPPGKVTLPKLNFPFFIINRKKRNFQID